MLWRLFLCLIAAQMGYADLEEQLRRIEMEPQEEQVEGIDCIYMINLDARPEKWGQSLRELVPYGIVPYRFSAVSGWELPLEVVNELGVKWEPWMAPGVMGTYYPVEERGVAVHEVVQRMGRNYFCHCMPLGSVGILLSHLSILKHAYEAGFETIWVMEDDIRVAESPHHLTALIRQLDAVVGKGGWDVLFTDPDTKNTAGQHVSCTSYARRPNFTPADPERFAIRIPISGEIVQVGARYGAYSMIVRRSGMRKILNFLRHYHLFLPYDMEYTLPNDIRLFNVTRDIVTTVPGALSDNGAPNYRTKVR